MEPTALRNNLKRGRELAAAARPPQGAEGGPSSSGRAEAVPPAEGLGVRLEAAVARLRAQGRAAGGTRPTPVSSLGTVTYDPKTLNPGELAGGSHL